MQQALWRNGVMSEQSCRQGSFPGRAPLFKRDDKKLWTRFGLFYFSVISLRGADRRNISVTFTNKQFGAEFIFWSQPLFRVSLFSNLMANLYEPGQGVGLVSEISLSLRISKKIGCCLCMESPLCEISLKSGEVSAGGMKISHLNIPSHLPRRNVSTALVHVSFWRLASFCLGKWAGIH